MTQEVNGSLPSMIKRLIITLVENAPATLILLYLIIRQDEFVQYLVEQCVIVHNR